MWKKRIINSTLILLSLFALTGFSSNQQAEETIIRITQIDTSNFPEVTVYVAITNAKGEPVGVDPARIKLMENEAAIPAEHIEGVGEINPLSVLLVMDISGSMLYVGKLEAAKTAARVFVEQLRPVDKVGLLTFHTEIDYVQPITVDRDLILSAINGIEAKDDTAMYDALSEAISIVSEIGGRKAIVAITDGLDTLSVTTPESVLEQIGPAGLSISTIGLGDPDQDLAEKTALDEDTLIYLAENAGGIYTYANDQESLNEIYQNYAIAFKSEYQLTYTSPSSLHDGVNRALSVSLEDSVNTVAESDQESITYNPGGLVPEVSEPIPLSFFLAIMAGLLALLFVPGAIKLVFKPAGKGAGKPKSRIKLKD